MLFEDRRSPRHSTQEVSIEASTPLVDRLAGIADDACTEEDSRVPESPRAGRDSEAPAPIVSPHWSFSAAIDAGIATDAGMSIQCKAEPDARPVAINGALDRASASLGAPLPEPLHHKFASALGADLSAVRVHTGGESAEAARTVAARAYTSGQAIHFGANQYAPGTVEGEHLLAHEVAHTVQQAATTAVQAKLTLGAADDPSEREADAAADRMVRGESVVVSDAPPAIRRTPVQTIVSDDVGHEWLSRYQVDIVGHVARLTLRLHLYTDPNAVGIVVEDSDVNTVYERAGNEFRAVWDGRFQLVEAITNERFDLRCALVRCEDASNAHLNILLHPLRGRPDRRNWYVENLQLNTYAHELGHQLGLVDEYPDAAAPNRQVRTDDSVMGDAVGPQHRQGDQGQFAHLRHGQTIAAAISRASGRNFTAALAARR